MRCVVAMILLACVFLLAAPCRAHAEDATEVSSWAELSDALAQGATSIRLVADAVHREGDSYLTVKGSRPVTIDLNGHAIDRGLSGAAPQGTSDSALRVEGGGRHAGGKLILTNSSSETGTVTGGSATYGGGVWVYNNGSLEVGSGVSICGNTAQYGGGIYVTVGQVTLCEGAMVEENVANYGGGLCVRYVAQEPGAPQGSEAIEVEDADTGMPTCTIGEGAQVRNNAATGVVANVGTAGGGAYIEYGQLILDGGSVAGNEDQGMGRGGGVCVWSGSLTINGGSISSNRLTGESMGTMSRGGGVFQHGGTITMNGGTIEGNETYPGSDAQGTPANDRDIAWFGGGVYQCGGTFDLYDGAICGNFAGDGGGGICQLPETYSCSLVMHGGTVDHNTSGSQATGHGYGGGICQELFDPTFSAVNSLSIEGGSVSNNSAFTTGGGICSALGNIELCGTAAIEANSAKWGGGVSIVADFLDVNTTCRLADKLSIANNVDAYGPGDLFFLMDPEQMEVTLDPDARVGLVIFPWYNDTSFRDGLLAERHQEVVSGLVSRMAMGGEAEAYEAILWHANDETATNGLFLNREGHKLVVWTEDPYAGRLAIVKDNDGMGEREREDGGHTAESASESTHTEPTIGASGGGAVRQRQPVWRMRQDPGRPLFRQRATLSAAHACLRQ